MKKIYFISRLSINGFILCLLLNISVGCNKLAGLPLQKNVPYNGGVLNTNSGLTTWDFIKSRGPGKGDSLFSLMYQAIIYSGIDKNLYTRPNTTYILYTDSAIIFHSSTGSVSTSSYWGYYKINKKAATSWFQYKGADSIALQNNLLYLMVNGIHSFNNIPITYSANNVIPLTVPFEIDTTLMPQGVNALNPNSLISFNQSDSSGNWESIYLNAFPGSKYGLSTTNTQYPGQKVVTGGITTKNGVVHVVSKVLYYQHK